MHIDLIQITREALLSGGCDADLIETLDPHAPIELQFKEHPCLRIAMLEGRVVRLDAQLNEYPTSDFGHVAAKLFDIATAPAPCGDPATR